MRRSSPRYTITSSNATFEGMRPPAATKALAWRAAKELLKFGYCDFVIVTDTRAKVGYPYKWRFTKGRKQPETLELKKPKAEQLSIIE